jgi:hypothetical protein
MEVREIGVQLALDKVAELRGTSAEQFAPLMREIDNLKREIALLRHLFQQRGPGDQPH